MPEMVTVAEIAKRLSLDQRTVGRLIAREKEALHLTLHRGKSDKRLLTKDDADKLIASYEARRGPIDESAEQGTHPSTIAMVTSTLFSWCLRRFRTA
jgi:DNA-binding transcriptional ArsR family regulator